MKYSQDIAEKMLNDPRWKGAIQPKMLRVWKNRDVIPNQYFNPRYVALVKANDPAANQVKDPYYNENFILKMDLTEEEKKTHDRLVEVIRRNEKISSKAIADQCGIPINIIQDAARDKSDKRFVYLRPQHVLALKKNLQELRIKIKSFLEKMQDRRVFRERDIKEMDELLRDERLQTSSVIGNRLYAGRVSARARDKQAYYDDLEVRHIIDKLSIFLIETSI